MKTTKMYELQPGTLLLCTRVNGESAHKKRKTYYPYIRYVRQIYDVLEVAQRREN